MLVYTPAGKPGMLLPEFNLPTVTGETLHARDVKGPTLIMFICNHCPYVQAIEDRLLTLAREFQPKGLQVVAICSNDPADYPEDAPAALRTKWEQKQFGFPYLVDETQSVARAFDAVCTPDLYLFGADRRLAYRGRLDDSWRHPERVQRQELREAIIEVLAGKPVNSQQNPSMGCSIKWKKGD